jgi:hypothetical protein
MATADPALLDARIRAAELALAARYSRTLVEHTLTTARGATMRVVEYPRSARGMPQPPSPRSSCCTASPR